MRSNVHTNLLGLTVQLDIIEKSQQYRPSKGRMIDHQMSGVLGTPYFLYM